MKRTHRACGGSCAFAVDEALTSLRKGGVLVIRNARIGAAEVEALAAHAGLPLAPGRAAVIAPVLDAWVADANALSRKMSEERCRLLVPVTVLVHPQADEAER